MCNVSMCRGRFKTFEKGLGVTIGGCEALLLSWLHNCKNCKYILKKFRQLFVREFVIMAAAFLAGLVKGGGGSLKFFLPNALTNSDRQEWKLEPC